MNQGKYIISGGLTCIVLIVGIMLYIYHREHEPRQTNKEVAEEVTPTEDLMREHGLLNRVMLIYEEIIRCIEKDKPFRAAIAGEAATIIRNFIENYHEKLEENYLFPLFEQSGTLVNEVTILREQHEAGRSLTAAIIQCSQLPLDPEIKKKLVQNMRSFITMYRVHESREDTVLFPTLHTLITPAQYDELGDIFEAKEHELFGEHGFETMVDTVALLEKELGIYELAQFTPHVTQTCKKD